MNVRQVIALLCLFVGPIFVIAFTLMVRYGGPDNTSVKCQACEVRK